jgi:hypothetical protein
MGLVEITDGSSAWDECSRLGPREYRVLIGDKEWSFRIAQIINGFDNLWV